MSGPPSLRAAGQALLYWEQRQQVNANNLANTETPGFRGKRVFSELLNGSIPGLGSVDDPRPGDIQETGNPLDLALIGPGSFLVQDGPGVRAVRSGSFTLNADGRIMDSQGRLLLGENGPMILPPGPVDIDSWGGVSVSGEVVGRLRIVEEAGLSDGLLDASTLRDIPTEDVRVRQGFIEGSNVSTLDALIEMTTIQRSFESVQNAVRAIDSMMDTAVNRIGRLE